MKSFATTPTTFCLLLITGVLPLNYCQAQPSDRYRVLLESRDDGSLESVNLLSATIEENEAGEILALGSCGHQATYTCLTNINRHETTFLGDQFGEIISLAGNGSFVARTYASESPYSFYSNGSLTPLALPSQPFASLRAANGSGQAVGWLFLEGPPYSAGILSTTTETSMLGDLLPGGSELQWAKDINDLGQIVGNGYAEEGSTSGFILTPTTTGGFSVLEIPSPFPGYRVDLFDINHRGDALGRLEVPNNEPVYFVLPAGASQVTPLIDFNRPTHYFIAERLTDTGIVSGQVIIRNPASWYPALFDTTTGRVIDARTIVATPGLTINQILDISRNGRAIFAAGSNGLNVVLRRLCRGDNDGDGTMTSTDFYAFLERFFAQSDSADLNRDDEVNSADFFYFLEEFQNSDRC